MAKAKNRSLLKAKITKNDEFYTRNTDIENELKYYRDQFRDKIIYCNCDDPVESEFYRYFHLNFHFFGMKKLISTHYDKHKSTYALIYQGGTSEISDNDYNSYDKKIPLKENGDFRSKESITYLKQADIVVTNPPFSLYREYVAQLMKYHKQFIIIGNKNSIKCKEIFPLIMHDKMWQGINPVKEFIQPDGSIKKMGNVCWFTNMKVKKPTDRVFLWNNFSQKEFPTYYNYAAFECSRLSRLPKNKEIDAWINKKQLNNFKQVYQNDLIIKDKKDINILVHIVHPIFGVPITFLDKYNPSNRLIDKNSLNTDNLANRFDIIGTDLKDMAKDLGITPIGKDFCDLYFSQGKKGHISPSMRNLAYIDKDGKAKLPFSRILVRVR